MIDPVPSPPPLPLSSSLEVVEAEAAAEEVGSGPVITMTVDVWPSEFVVTTSDEALPVVVGGAEVVAGGVVLVPGPVDDALVADVADVTVEDDAVVAPVAEVAGVVAGVVAVGVVAVGLAVVAVSVLVVAAAVVVVGVIVGKSCRAGCDLTRADLSSSRSNRGTMVKNRKHVRARRETRHRVA